MFLYQSNRLENLFVALCDILDDPLDDPLAAEIIVVQNPGMARWLSQHIAHQTGIAANLSFPLPASFIWDIFSQTLEKLPDLSLFDRDVLLWRVLHQLKRLDDPSLLEISTYLQDDPDGGKLFQLSARITDLFDQYLVYRPDMLLDWEQGRDNQWQAVLWRRLTENSAVHRAGLLRKFLAAWQQGRLRTDTLPKRVCLFGINSLAPAWLEVIARISERIDVHVFHLSPCRQAWDDILPERLLAIKRRTWRSRSLDDISGYFTSGNPLLASMGSLGREFFSRLMEYDPREIDLYVEPDSSSLLGRIQGDILELRDRTGETADLLDPADSSISFHCCHSPMREVQVLHDRLLDCFAADPTLKPADILVMAPDISRYAPAVAGVFGAVRGELRIPWSLADCAQRGEQPVLDGFLELLELIAGRCTASDLPALLENRAIRRRMQLDEQDISALRSRIRAAGIRWGLDQEQRSRQGLAEYAAHTWEFGLDRLLLGYITGPLEQPLLDIMPCSCSGMFNDCSLWLGGLTEFVRRLQRLYRQLAGEHSPADWSRILLRMLDDFFDDTGNSHDQDGLLMLREVITHFAECCEKAQCNEPLNFSLIRSHFERLLAEFAGGKAFLAGRVTFCNMVPMRSVPFKIIWLLGMNDTDYPRSQRPPDFDCMAQKPRLGDRSRRDDDRYLFLEALLSVRSQLFISWVGRDQQENTSLPSSVVVAELRDYIDRAYQTAESRPASAMLTVEYPLQPFSRHCFDGTSETASYADVWLPATENNDNHVFVQSPLTGDSPEQIDIGELCRFWTHPVRFFLERRLGLCLYLDDEQLPEEEVFQPDHLQRYQLAREIMTSLLAGDEPQPVFHRLQAAGELPGGKFGHLLYQEIFDGALALVQKVGPLLTAPVEPIEVKLGLHNCKLGGWLTSLYSTGRISYRPTRLKPRDLLRLWIHHLVLSLQQPAGVQPVSIHAATDRVICFKTVDNPAGELEPLLHYYLRGLGQPLHFYPKTSMARAEGKTEAAGMKNARNAWHSGYFNGEEQDPAYELALQGQDPLDDRFQELAGLFVPVLDHVQEFSEPLL